MTYTTPFTEFPALTSNLEKCPVPVFIRNCNTKQYHVFTAPGYGALICGIPCFIQGDSRHGGYYYNIAGRLCSENFGTLKAAKKDFYLRMAEYVTGPRSEAVRVAMEMINAAISPAEPDQTLFPEDLPAVQAEPAEVTEPQPEPEPIPEPQPEPAAPAPEQPAPERPKARRRKNPEWIGKTLTAWERRPKDPQPQPEPAAPPKPARPEWIGRKMIITIGERSARPAG